MTRFLLCLVIACIATGAQAQARPKLLDSGVADPSSAIWMGNSFFYYNNSMHGHVGALIRAAGAKPMRMVSVTISGSGFDWHDVGSHFRPNAVSSYSFDANNNINFNKFERIFDLAIMMDCSQCPVHPQLG